MYRVDAVWLGPPRATFPWRARYVSYGVGLLVVLFIMFVQRRLGIGLDFFSVAWALVGTVVITRFLGKKIDYERPLGQVVSQFWAEVTGPRARRRAAGGPVRAGHVRVRSSGGRGMGGSPSAVSGRPAPAAVSGGGGAKAAPVRIGSRPAAAERSAPNRAAREATAPVRPGRDRSAVRAANRAAKKQAKKLRAATPAPRSSTSARSVDESWQKAGSRGRA